MSESEMGVTSHCRSDIHDTVSAVLETNLVGDIVCTGVLHLHHHVRMQEVGLDHVWHKGRVLLLEHDGYNVVAYVPLPLQLVGPDKEKLTIAETSQTTS